MDYLSDDKKTLLKLDSSRLYFDAQFIYSAGMVQNLPRPLSFSQKSAKK
jgi:hypothetical protein